METIEICQNTDKNRSLVVGRNGTHQLCQVRIWTGTNGTLFIDGIGRRGTVLNAGFIIDVDARIKLLTKLKGKIRVDVRGGVAYCDDPCVEIVDHDNR